MVYESRALFSNIVLVSAVLECTQCTLCASEDHGQQGLRCAVAGNHWLILRFKFRLILDAHLVCISHSFGYTVFRVAGLFSYPA